MSDETRFRKKTRAIEARQWQPGDLARAGEMVGWLLARGASFDHPSGTGETTTLAIGTAAGTMVAEPGWWVTLGEGAWWAYPPDMFEQAYEPAESAAATVSERDRLAELENAISWNTSCTSCAAVLDSSIREHERAERAEGMLAAIRRGISPATVFAAEDAAREMAQERAEPAADGLAGAAATSESPEAQPGAEARSEDAIRYDERRRVLDAARPITVLMTRADGSQVAAVQWSRLLQALGLKP